RRSESTGIVLSLVTAHIELQRQDQRGCQSGQGGSPRGRGERGQFGATEVSAPHLLADGPSKEGSISEFSAGCRGCLRIDRRINQHLPRQRNAGIACAD